MSVNLKLTSCENCPHCLKDRFFTADSWEFIIAWNCTHSDLTCKPNHYTDHYEFRHPPGIALVEHDRDKPKDIPRWCPLRDQKEEARLAHENRNKNEKKKFEKVKKGR